MASVRAVLIGASRRLAAAGGGPPALPPLPRRTASSSASAPAAAAATASSPTTANEIGPSPPRRALRAFADSDGGSRGRRGLATAAAADPKPSPSYPSPSVGGGTGGGGPRTLPTRHSRTLPSPICPHRLLPDVTSHLLSSPPGSLFSYPETDAPLRLTLEEEIDRALERSDPVRQKFEYCLRGHAALIGGSVVETETERDDDWADGAVLGGRTMPAEGTKERGEWTALREYEGGDDRGLPEGALHPLDRVEIMERLIDRIEEEGKLYAEMRGRLKSQVARVGAGFGSDSDSDSDSDSSSSSSSDDSESEAEFSDSEADFHAGAASAPAWRAARLSAALGSPPGPSTSMYDLLLDAIAVTAPLAPLPRDAGPDDPFLPQRALDVHHRILDRHRADGGPDNLNPYSTPTALTYNGVIRTCVETPYDPSDASDRSRMVRDMCVDASFRMYDAIYRSDVADRNAATYVYMFRILSKVFPPSRSRGNIGYGLFVHAREERVLTPGVVEAIGRAMTPSNGEEFDRWYGEMTAKIEEDGGELPQSWTERARRRMHRKWDSGY